MTEQACASCQKSIPSESPGGLCPACLLRQGLTGAFTQTSAGSGGSTVDETEIPESALSREPAGRYTTIEDSGQGGMGKVYLVRDTHLGREVALKELLPQDAVHAGAGADAANEERVALARFTREARVTAQLQHPAITPVYELGRRQDGSYYYTMKYVRGKTLAAAIKNATSLDERLKLLPNFVALCHAIAFAHSRGVIHRDIKPANVMVGDFGETVVVDWGIAKVKGVVESPSPASSTPGLEADGLQTLHGTALGTPAYMPPEQAQGLIGSLDQRSDIYSLGAVLYEILAGRRPFAGSSAREVLAEVLTKPPLPLGKVDPTIPKEFVEICEKAMSRIPEERPKSASELAELVQNVRLRGPKSQGRKWAERAAVAALLLIPLGLFAFNRWTDAELDRVRGRVAAKGFDLRSGPQDFATFGRDATPLPPGARHGAGLLFALTWEFPQLGDRDAELWKRVSGLRVQSEDFPWPKGSEKERLVRALAGEVEPVVAAIRSAAALPRGGGRAVLAKAIKLGGDPFATEIPDLAALSSGVTLLAHDAYLARLDGDPGRALLRTVEGLRFTQHLEDIPFMIGVLTRVGLTQSTLAPLRSSSLREATETDLLNLDGALRSSAVGPSVRAAVESEVRSSLYAFSLVRADGAARVAAVMEGTPHNLPTFLWGIYGRGPLRWWGNLDEIGYIERAADVLDATHRAPHEARADLERINRDVVRTGSKLRPLLGMFPHFDRMVARVAELDSELNYQRIRVALERHRLGRQTYPESLMALAPQFLDDVPIHIATGLPFVYARTPGGYDLKHPALRPVP